MQSDVELIKLDACVYHSLSIVLIELLQLWSGLGAINLADLKGKALLPCAEVSAGTESGAGSEGGIEEKLLPGHGLDSSVGLVVHSGISAGSQHERLSSQIASVASRRGATQRCCDGFTHFSCDAVFNTHIKSLALLANGGTRSWSKLWIEFKQSIAQCGVVISHSHLNCHRLTLAVVQLLIVDFF